MIYLSQLHFHVTADLTFQRYPGKSLDYHLLYNIMQSLTRVQFKKKKIRSNIFKRIDVVYMHIFL